MPMDLSANSAFLGGKCRLQQQLLSFKLYMQVIFLWAIVAVAMVLNSPAQAATAVLAPAPAPAPAAPSFENVTQSLVFGGDYTTFIELLVETKVEVIFQTIANDTDGPGITIFAPTDDAFKTKLVSSLLKNLTALQKVRLVEYHALNVYLAFKNLQNSNNNVTSTYATFNGGGSGRYQVNLTFTGGGRLEIASGWTTAKISTTVYSRKPVSIFAIDQVLLPDEIFGLPPPPPPPAPPALPLPPSPAPSAAPPPPTPPKADASSASPARLLLITAAYLLPCTSGSPLLFFLLVCHALLMQGAA
ncbi:hypothetical protein GOP47_0010710 [Adiantum capillus-veneris]|uniref:FAS1 domain-containing protein n=1 Tax=Adiantum capillus-veneris TaxID=13818 RepID=A0A9D4UVF0_ADICA|nr:hypothetical protein GOP47_0010710 [Adiantum capillus-veneris]